MNPFPLYDAIDTQEGLEATLKALAERLGVRVAEQPQAERA